MDPFKPILVNIPTSLLTQIDGARKILNRTRTDMIRRSLVRDMTYVVQCELPRALAHLKENEVAYERWTGSADGADEGGDTAPPKSPQ